MLAVAIAVDPEVLIVDEALAVGDAYFRHRCMRKVQELRSQGVTIVFVSHSISDVKAIGELASLPPKEEIFAKLLYLIQAPAQRLVTTVGAVGRNLAVVVDQCVQNNKFQS